MNGASSTRIFIAQLQERDAVDAVFLVRSKSVAVGKTGKSYLALTLCDRSGQIEARMWDNVDTYAPVFRADDFIRIRGSVTVYQRKKQLVIGELQKVAKQEVNPSEFLPTTVQDIETMYKTLLAMARGMKNKYLRQLVLDTLEDPEIAERFKKCPAARTIHHAWIGGLLEHTLSVTQVLLALAQHYKRVDSDLLIVGAIFHDIGKIWELEYESSFGYTDKGKLVGHLSMGSELIEKKASAIASFPEKLKLHCKHLVLSHHGKLEHGSPKLPSTIEALLVAYVDDLDSKVSALLQFFDHEKEGGPWTGMHPIFDRTFLMPEGS